MEMPYFIFRYVNTPVRFLWFNWRHRHETPDQREARIAATNLRFRALYNQHKREMEYLPESREMMEVRREMDQLMDEVLGKE